MSKIEFIFKTYETEGTISITTVKGLYLLEKEGFPPRTIIKLSIDEYKNIKTFDYCEIYREGALFFKGDIRSTTTCGNEAEIELATVCDDEPPKEKRASLSIIEKFKQENPDLFTPISLEEIDRVGDKVYTDLVNPSSDIVEFDHEIVADTMKFEKSNELPIGEIDLEIKASWISKREGDVTLSTRIENRFRTARVNTLTPSKLLSSWPEFGCRLSRNNKATKYFISMSRLRETEVVKMPPIVIDSTIPPVVLSKYIFDGKLMVSWDYDQYVTETLSAKFLNTFAKIKNRKNIKINLKNIQEYVENAGQRSFFKSRNGQLILSEIQRAIGNYIALSMRNIQVSFNVQECNKSRNLSCRDWIRIDGRHYKVTQIERNISAFENTVKIKASGFEIDLPNNNFVDIVVLDAEEAIHHEDVIQDIVVQNDSEAQYEKLLEHISNLKKSNKITKGNYKHLITNFLNDNQTKIQIIAKPLKTEHCETKYIELSEPIYFLGRR
ncbi:MAG: hypothetical protein LBB34_00075 [Holosporales bacterium]|jgi:hypothetical protein|nr:hypothetical protein [Holosporales bacterium]